MTDPHTQESRGFGFVKMETPADAEACIEALNQTVIEGKTMTVAHARRGRARTPTPGRYHGVKVDIGGPRFGGGGGGYGGGYGGGGESALVRWGLPTNARPPVPTTIVRLSLRPPRTSPWL